MDLQQNHVHSFGPFQETPARKLDDAGMVTIYSPLIGAVAVCHPAGIFTVVEIK